MRSPRVFAIVLGLASLAVLIAPGNRRFRSDRITMVVWGQPFEDRLFRDVYARGFEADHPGTRVDYLRYSEVPMKYAAWHARDLGAEIMRLRITDYHTMVRKGMLEPLDEYLSDSVGLSLDGLDRFPPRLLDSLRVDGRLYALPQDTALYGLYYNRAIFDSHNLAHPEAAIEYPTDRWTWEDLRAAAQALTSDNPGSPIRGLDLNVWEWPFLHFFLQAGGRIWDELGTTTLIDSRAGVDALMFLASLASDGSWIPDFERTGGVGADARFASGSVAMFLGGSWWAPSFQVRAPDLDFAIAPPPRGTTDASIGGSVLWGISASAPNKRTAWEMLSWLVADEQSEAYWSMLRVAPPADIRVVQSESFQTAEGVADASGRTIVPPMSKSDFGDLAAWIVPLLTPDGSGSTRAVIPTGEYQAALELEIRSLMIEFFSSSDRSESRARALLTRAVEATHRHIDRDRAARGLTHVERKRHSTDRAGPPPAAAPPMSLQAPVEGSGR
ncbi:MAG: sugar ABC transporter substrate-binding protein [Phycisphaeraceae bacterium]|nr:sugar ABC transporter substrate-binding protein [Phycisphaeraceae bacterium]